VSASLATAFASSLSVFACSLILFDRLLAHNDHILTKNAEKAISTKATSKSVFKHMDFSFTRIPHYPRGIPA
jgi:hypothetical protein